MKPYPSVLAVACAMASLTTNVARGFSISAVTLSPGNVVEPMVELHMTIDITTPSQGTSLYAPSQISSNAAGIHVDVFPTSGLLAVIGSLRETVTLGVFPVGTYHYEVVIHPNSQVNWGTRTNQGIFTVQEQAPLPEVYITATVAETLEPSANTRVSPGEFTITRVGNTNEPLILFLEFTGTATFKKDYQEVSQFLTMPAGATKLTVPVGPLDDTAVEGDETVTATLSANPPINSLPNYRVNSRLNQATVVIHDNDFPNDLPVVSITGVSEALESCPSNAICAGILFSLRRTGPGLDRPLTVFLLYRGTALADVDYRVLPGQVTFEAGRDSATASSMPIDDTLYEGDETIDAYLIGGFDYHVDPNRSQATTVIRDNDPPAPPVVSLELVTRDAAETLPFQNAIFWAEFRVLRTGPTTEELIIFLNTQQGTARLGEDYWLNGVTNGSTVRIPAGTNSVRVRLYPIDDNIYEGDETVFFHLLAPPPGNAPYGIDLAHSSVSMVIHDNDPVATWLAVTSPSNDQQFQPGDSIEIRAQIIGPGNGQEWSIDFFDGGQRIGTTRPDVPIWWSDASGGQHVISARATNSQGTVLTSAPPVTIQVGPGAALPVVKIGASSWRTGEPCPVCFVVPDIITIERTGPTNSALTVFLEIDGTATPGADYQALPASVEIPAGQRSAQLTLLARDDHLAEGPEVVRLRVLAQPPPLLPPTYFVNVYANEALVVIFDDEPDAPQARLDIIAPTNGSHLRFPSVIQLSALAVYTQNEVYGPVEFYAGDQLVARSQVKASTGPAIPGLPSVHTAYWTNPPAGQYVLTARTRLSFDQSITSTPVNVTVDSPMLPVVGLETVPLQNPQALEFCPPNADCAYPSFVVRRSGPTNADLRVYLSYSGSATAGLDYSSLPASLVIPAGRDAAFLGLLPKDDTFVEGSETVIARFTAVPGAGYVQDPNHASATITIVDNEHTSDTLVSIRATSPIAEEDSYPFDRLNLVGVFTISRSGPTNSSLPVYVQYSGSATAGKDYPVLPWVVSIPAGATAAEIRIVPTGDNLTEGVETLVATISNCPPPGLLPPCYNFEIDPAYISATVFIRDDGRTRASLTITNPKDGTNFNVGETIFVEATAIDLDGYISRAEFFDGNQRIGDSQIDFIRAPDPGTPIDHSFAWHGATPGVHLLTASATDTHGTPISSPPVRVTVGPASNQLPHIAITRPVSGAEFPLDTAIEIVADARDPDGYVRKVEFFADGRKIGEASVEFIRAPDPGQLQTFAFLWHQPAAGPHALTARATDDDGEMAASTPVEIKVAMSEPLPIVTVTAPDPFAVEPHSDGDLNTASFRIRRHGPTNDALVVAYTLQGTAGNGTDYERLPGLATIPAGQESINVIIRPLADNLSEGLETVLLRLDEPPPPRPEIQVINPYRVGQPALAAAVISDGPWPSNSVGAQCLALAGSLVHVCFAAEAGSNFRIEASDDLRNWETLFDAVSNDDTWHFVDNDRANHPRRYYRLRPEPVMELDD